MSSFCLFSSFEAVSYISSPYSWGWPWTSWSFCLCLLSAGSHSQSLKLSYSMPHSKLQICPLDCHLIFPVVILCLCLTGLLVGSNVMSLLISVSPGSFGGTLLGKRRMVDSMKDILVVLPLIAMLLELNRNMPTSSFALCKWFGHFACMTDIFSS